MDNTKYISQYNEVSPELLNELATRSCAGALSKLSLNRPLSPERAIMLIIRQIVVAFEASEAGMYCTESLPDLERSLDHEVEDKVFKDYYERNVKGSIDQELAGVVALLLDFAGTYGFRIVDTKTPKLSFESLTNGLYQITQWLSQPQMIYLANGSPMDRYFAQRHFAIILHRCFEIAQEENIPLMLHLQLRVRYNELP